MAASLSAASLRLFHPESEKSLRRFLAPHRCPGCEIRKALCFCAAIPRLELKTRVVILMHTAEEVLTTNTARLTVKALPNSEIRIRGRKVDRMSTDGLRQNGRETLLLFPSPTAEELNEVFVAGLTGPVNLIVPDGSWRQAQKMVRREPGLTGMRTVKLPVGPPSIYKLRIQPAEEGLCTLEAIARSLGILESPTAQRELEALLAVMVERTLWSRGALSPEQYAQLDIPRQAFSNEPSEAAPGETGSRDAIMDPDLD